MKIETARRLAADYFKSGISRVWIDPNNIEEVTDAATRADIRALTKKGIIQLKNAKGNSNSRLKKRIVQRSKELRRGPGSIRGTRNARFPRKTRWVKTVRALRDELRKLDAAGSLNSKEYRTYYRIIKSGTIKSRAQLRAHVSSSKSKGE
ncbi:MAG: 50S ribosomal protein L19e [Thermoplasmatales archaeon]|nr:50S ribosomal protein L19e [Thermoplasmatales archaeon]MCW6170555.1 50S ribosomal protein L19e [Thermoplasmatales archaeon]